VQIPENVRSVRKDVALHRPERGSISSVASHGGQTGRISAGAGCGVPFRVLPSRGLHADSRSPTTPVTLRARASVRMSMFLVRAVVVPPTFASVRMGARDWTAERALFQSRWRLGGV
jgi:hypothetical protein